MSKINKEAQAAMPQKLLHELFDYDWVTGGLVNKTNRSSVAKKGHLAGWLHKITGYVVIRINGHNHQSHRLVWTYFYGDYPDGEQPFIDHINGDKSDNRIANLRVSSHHENMKNRKMQSDNTSGVNGVSRYERLRPSGKIYAIWTASWCDENRKPHGKTFNIGKLGEEGAKQAAIDYRTEQMRLLELNHGIIYSDRHGI